MSTINWTDQVTPLNAVNMNALEQIVRKNAANGYVGLDASSNIAFASAQRIVWNADTNLYRAAANSLKTDGAFTAVGAAGLGFVYNPATAVGNPFASLVGAEANYRFSLDVNGKLQWGAGSTAADVNLYRGAADQLWTDDLFLPNSLRLIQAAAGTTIINLRASTDTSNRMTVTTAGILNWGDGAGGALDTNLQRTAVGQLTVGGTSVFAPVSNAVLGVVRAGNSLEWGHSNTAGYRSTLGSHTSAGDQWIALHGEAGTNANSFRTRGVQASIIKGNAAGGFAFGNVANANADNQTFVQTMALNAAGNLLVTGTLAANGAISGASLATSAYGTSLPGSPVDGQEFTLVDSLTAPTYVWRFRYNAGSSSAYKWEFLGGSPFSVLGAATPYAASLATWWNPVSGLQSAALRAGDYLARITWLYSGPANGPVFMYGCSVGTTNPPNYAAAVPTALGYAGGMAETRLLAVANGSVIQPLWQQQGGTVNTVILQVPLFSLQPIRVA